jgi:hypothetical protein
LLCLASSTHAHDLHGILAERSAMDPALRQRIDDANELRRILSERAKSGESGLEAVVQRALRWDKAALTVCFLNGETDARRHIAEVANEWIGGTAIRFDFGAMASPRTCVAASPSDIRINLTGTGNWSYVGTHAKSVAADKPTLHLSGMAHGNPLSSYERFLVLHEFGHALGFEHEHQSPEGGCTSEFDWKALPTVLQWSETEVRQNMTRFDEAARKTGLVYSEFDPKSVMMYALPVGAFLAPQTAKCYLAQANSKLSALDKAGVLYLYPATPTARAPAAPVSVIAVANRWSWDTHRKLARLRQIALN